LRLLENVNVSAMTDEVLPDVFNESVIITWSNAFCYAPSPLPQKGLN